MIWHTFGEHGASGTPYTGPWGDNRDEWEPRGRPRGRVRLTEARWEFDGVNLSRFLMGYHASRTNDMDRDLRDVIRAVERFTRGRGWWTDSQPLPTEQQAIDWKVISANGGWNEVDA